MSKILFIQPSQYRSKTKTIVKQHRLYLPGLVFPLLAAMTPDNWDVEINLEVIDDITFETDADLVGIGAMGHSIFRAIEVAREFKKRGKTVFMGGYMASMIPEMALKVVDSVVIGDAEISYPKLLRDFETIGKIDKVYNNPVTDLKDLPLPRYDLLLKKKIGFMLPVQAARGCPHLCSFCSIACMYKGRHIIRPIEEVIRDIKYVKKLGYNKFYLIDDNLSGNPTYLSELCDQIKPLKMQWATQCTLNLAWDRNLLGKVAESGCKILSIGIEGITQEGLNQVNKSWLRVKDHKELIKRITAAGIMVSAEMILGTDSDTEKSIRLTYDFIMETRVPLVRFYVLTPAPGTSLYQDLKASGRLIHEEFEYYNSVNCVYHPGKISHEQLEKMFWWMNRQIFSLKSIFLRTIGNSGFKLNPLLYLYAFVVNLHYLKDVRNGDAPIIV